jgi:glycosyltransferase involved in cell wall biosynthesis
VLLLITELAYGGTPRSVQALALGLVRCGWPVRVASLFSKADIAFELEAAGIPVDGLGIERTNVGVVAWRLRRLLRARRVTVLHCFNFHANLLGRLVAATAGVPIVIASERTVEPAKARWRVAADRLTWRLAHRWTVNARAVARVLAARERVTPDCIDVIPTGVDADRFKPRPRDDAFRAAHGISGDERVIVCVGRLDRYKGQEHLIEAFARLCAVDRRIRLALIGDGRFRARLEAQAVAAGVRERVTFTGSVGDVRPALAAADVFVQASDTEGMPGAVLEAMAMEVPVVATAVGGTPEVVTDGQDGLLVPAERPDALADAVARMLTEPGLGERLGACGRRRVVDELSVERAVTLTDALYRRLWDRPHR